jgi:hypothetical protein
VRAHHEANFVFEGVRKFLGEYRDAGSGAKEPEVPVIVERDSSCRHCREIDVVERVRAGIKGCTVILAVESVIQQKQFAELVDQQHVGTGFPLTLIRRY